MSVVIFGASGIIGQHMRLCVPEGTNPIWVRRKPDMMHVGLNMTDEFGLKDFLTEASPTTIVNLAGESNTDAVEARPKEFYGINAKVPGKLAAWCKEHNAHYVHVSTQAVFLGDEAPYSPESFCMAVNDYGRQKFWAELDVMQSGARCTIVRPTFVLGVRPIPSSGRRNPVEQMLEEPAPSKQVDDRYFSVSFAADVAAAIWNAVRHGGRADGNTITHVGDGTRLTRYQVARALGVEATACSHDDFPGIAPRPKDTTYVGTVNMEAVRLGLAECKRRHASRAALDVEQRAREISMFTNARYEDCLALLSTGFNALHACVSSDFRMAHIAEGDDDALLAWYRKTEAYMWELSAYHCDAGFNYTGICSGVVEALKAKGARRVLCLGDGIGDLTILLSKAGMYPTYHDLAGSRTADFAHARMAMHLGDEHSYACEETGAWNPKVLIGATKYDAVVSFDFLEHVTDVPAWVDVVRKVLKPGGAFFAQNAFACGSGTEGSIPMHLARNDRFEKDWDPMLEEMGFTQLSSNWYVTAEGEKEACA